MADAHVASPSQIGVASLIDLKAEGITTPLMSAYGEELLRRAGADTLEAAREQLVRAVESRAGADGHS
jgi:hypothetical protein